MIGVHDRDDARGEKALGGDAIEVTVVDDRNLAPADTRGELFGADGGCIDFSREFARNVCPGTADIVLPG